MVDMGHIVVVLSKLLRDPVTARKSPPNSNVDLCAMLWVKNFQLPTDDKKVKI